MMNKWSIFVLLSSVIWLRPALAQISPSYTAMTGVLQGTGAAASNLAVNNSINFAVTYKPQAATLRERNRSAKLYMRLDLGNDYVRQVSNWNFNVQVDINYQFGTSGLVARTLTVNQISPEVLKIDDVLPSFALGSPAFGATVTAVSINDGNVSPSPLTGLLADFVNKNVRLNITLAREFDVDVRLASNGLMSPAPVIYPVTTLNRLATFSWQPNGVTPYPNYEVQILKVDNTETAYVTNLNQIAVAPDWSRALKVETQSYTNTLSLTMGEGTGYYLWRIRPIGSYFEDGIANSENYGQWSYSVPNGSLVTLNKNTLVGQPGTLPFAFYFTDPDENINWIYNRIFTEGDNYDKQNPTGTKTSEGISYADGLQRVRQNQKYNSSENTNLVTQTVPDYMGRPALSTIPVPVNGRLTGYKLGFVTNTVGALYTAAMYDEDANMSAPEPVNDVSSAFRYYSSNVNASPSNQNVPSAEGYPFKRTVYSNDGSGRVVEESGVGKAHSLGTQANGQGRTTRMMYCMPTDDELIRVFGDEAPLAESVLKTITVDQNNVMSISYTSKEGKVIATAMTSENSPNLMPLSRAATNLTVTNSIDQNTSAGGKMVATKRIAVISNSTAITFAYAKVPVAGGSGCPTPDCAFRMRLYLVDIKQNVTYVSDADGSAGTTDFVVGNGTYNFPAGWRFVRSGNSNTLAPASLTANGSNQITLNSGEYIVIKEIFSGNGDNYAESLVDLENEKTKPIIDAIAAQMLAVNSPATYSTFVNYMATLSASITNYQGGGGVTSAQLLNYLGIDPADLPVGYVFPLDFSLPPVTTSPGDSETNDMKISTGCCGTMSVPIPKDPTCYACDGSPNPAYSPSIAINISGMKNANLTAPAGAITPYGFYDFKNAAGWSGLNDIQKRDAINQLVEREFIIPLQNKMSEEGMNINKDLWKIAPGFSYESLNFMISNMLISQYYTGVTIENGGVWYAATPVSGGYSLTSAMNALQPDYNYDCKKIWEAWTSAIALINSFEVGANENVLNTFNDQDGPNSGQDNTNDDENWEDLSKRQKKKLKKKLGQEMEDFSNSSEGQVSTARQEALTNIINDFIDQVKPQYYAIIDGAPLPKHISSAQNAYPDDYFYTFSNLPQGQGLGIYANLNIDSYAYNDSPYLFETNNGSPILQTAMCNGNPVNEMYYPYILKPEWMFKYFVYNVFENQLTAPPAINYLDDNDALLPHQVHIDVARDYNEPYSYLPVAVQAVTLPGDLCKQPPSSTYTMNGNPYSYSYYHLNWTSADRGSFYAAIKGAPRCPQNKGTAAGDDYFADPVSDLPDCAPKAVLIAEAMQRIDDLIDKVKQMEAAFVQELTNELVSSCYTIVACKTGSGQVTMNEITVMAQAAITTTTLQLQGIRNKFSALTYTDNVACASPSLTNNVYLDGMCNLPSCSQVDCKEIIYYNDNSLGVVSSRRLEVKLFADCDRKILEMIGDGDFLPYIPPLSPSCPKAANSKPWQQGSCSTDLTCDPDYNEKTNCSNADYEKYSKTYSVQAGN